MRSRENGVGPPDNRDGELVLDDFERFVKGCHSGKTVSTNILEGQFYSEKQGIRLFD